MDSDWVSQLMDAEKCFRRSCNQILLLNRVLEELQSRYDSASKQHMRAFRYSLRMRISVLEGVRNMYYHYASMKADLICRLRQLVQIEHADLQESDSSSDHYIEIDSDEEYDFSDSDFDYSDFDEDDFELEDDNYLVVKDTTLDGSMDIEGADRALIMDNDDSNRDRNNGGDKMFDGLNNKDDKR